MPFTPVRAAAARGITLKGPARFQSSGASAAMATRTGLVADSESTPMPVFRFLRAPRLYDCLMVTSTQITLSC
jgi:hypothetical protein